MITVRCRICGKVFLMPDAILGQWIQCSYCTHQIPAVLDPRSDPGKTPSPATGPLSVRRAVQAAAAVVLAGILALAWIVSKAESASPAQAISPAAVEEPSAASLPGEDEPARQLALEQERLRRVEILERARTLEQRIKAEDASREPPTSVLNEHEPNTEQSDFGRILEDAMRQRKEDEVRERRRIAQQELWDTMAWQRAWREQERQQLAREEQAAVMAEMQRHEREALEHQRQIEVATASRPVMIQETNTNVQAGAVSTSGWGPGVVDRPGAPYARRERPSRMGVVPSWTTPAEKTEKEATHDYVIKGSALR